MAESSSAAPTEEDLGGSSDADGNADVDIDSKQPGTSTSTTAAATIAKEDLIELIRAVKFKNADYSQRQVYQEIVTEIPTKFPQYADSLNPNTLCLNDVKKAWKKAILQQQQPKAGSNNNNNNDLAERLRKMTTNPEVYTVGLNNNNSNNTEDLSSTGSSMARDYVARFLEEQQAESSVQQRQLLEDYVHVFLDVPADSSVTKKPHQALINFQSQNSSSSSKKNKVAAAGKGNNKKQKGKKKSGNASSNAAPEATSTTASASVSPPPPFEDAIVVKIQMAAPVDENDTAKHPMLLYDQTRTYKTFVHPDGVLTGGAGASSTTAVTVGAAATNANADDDDGYSRLARWIRAQGVGGALGASGGTKAYFYGRLTNAGAKTNQILSIYVKSLAPPEAQGW